MIEFLAKRFIPHATAYDSPEVRQHYGILCSIVGIVLNLLLFAGKLLAGMLSGSIAITADAFNNLSDGGSSLVTLFGFRLAGQAPDPEHPFGHGRIEYLSGLVVSALILLMGVELAKGSVNKILHPEPVVFSWLAIAILAMSIAVKFYMSRYNRKIGEKIHSAAMKATATDSLSDTVSTTVVLFATLAGQFTSFNVDGYCGAAVSLFILWAGINAMRETIDPLLGQPPEPEFVEEIYRIVMEQPLVCGVHDLVVHNYGPGRVMISLHAEVPAHEDLLMLHDMIDNAEKQLQTELHCAAVIHMDPVVTSDERVGTLRHEVALLLKQISPDLTIHDFRMVEGPTHTNLIFDAVLPFGHPQSNQEVATQIQSLVKTLDDRYCTVVEVEHSYTS